MSTGADCGFWETEERKWFYKLQRYPYGETMDYAQYGPFPHFRDAEDHLNANHANPGGYWIEPQPCEHPEHLRIDRSKARWSVIEWECRHCGFKKEKVTAGTRIDPYAFVNWTK